MGSIFLGLLLANSYSASADNSSPAINKHLLSSTIINTPYIKQVIVIPCVLENDKPTFCYQLSFNSNPIADGPYCPKTLDDTGGLYNYDGITNPGFQVLKRTFFESMENDGYDIVDDQGNIRISPPKNTGSQFNYCFEAQRDDSLIITYTFPIFPIDLAVPSPNNTVFDMVGFTLNGIPIEGPAPSVVNGAPLPDGGTGVAGNVPAIDPCGGHVDPSGYYHFHMQPETINHVLKNNNIYDVFCSNVTQDSYALLGYAMDGYPLYADKDLPGMTQTKYDQCNGHFGPTLEYPFGIYHYHASNKSIPNTPPCLKGATAKNSFSIE
ncbi:YHYH protein [Spartinivicinus poritis]|uniref:YHYH protein n=1 Tax=Spartinivicinus poritis TaxID=2994640 RepID=A0ABT5UFY2_9GAMM|nr:YHYH protein [Spartinivicinus sp. A2-2]MDE1464412.1 YHYH protein [Spartinivicinus sp. A2-2]